MEEGDQVRSKENESLFHILSFWDQVIFKIVLEVVAKLWTFLLFVPTSETRLMMERKAIDPGMILLKL